MTHSRVTCLLSQPEQLVQWQRRPESLGITLEVAAATPPTVAKNLALPTRVLELTKMNEGVSRTQEFQLTFT